MLFMALISPNWPMIAKFLWPAWTSAAKRYVVTMTLTVIAVHGVISGISLYMSLDIVCIPFIDAKTGHSFPLVSLSAPANHYDSNVLPFLVKLAQAVGIDLKLITADEAYHDKDDSLLRDTGILVTALPEAKVLVPENVDRESGAVFLDGICTIPMQHVACEAQTHEYKCVAATGECHRSSICT
jgi:hypothetical protein